MYFKKRMNLQEFWNFRSSESTASIATGTSPLLAPTLIFKVKEFLDSLNGYNRPKMSVNIQKKGNFYRQPLRTNNNNKLLLSSEVLVVKQYQLYDAVVVQSLDALALQECCQIVNQSAHYVKSQKVEFQLTNITSP